MGKQLLHNAWGKLCGIGSALGVGLAGEYIKLGVNRAFSFTFKDIGRANMRHLCKHALHKLSVLSAKNKKECNIPIYHQRFTLNNGWKMGKLEYMSDFSILLRDSIERFDPRMRCKRNFDLFSLTLNKAVCPNTMSESVTCLLSESYCKAS